MFGRQLSDAASEGGGDAAPKTNRKKGKDFFAGKSWRLKQLVVGDG